jgi:hypothetical protein
MKNTRPTVRISSSCATARPGKRPEKSIRRRDAAGSFETNPPPLKWSDLGLKGETISPFNAIRAPGSLCVTPAADATGSTALEAPQPDSAIVAIVAAPITPAILATREGDGQPRACRERLPNCRADARSCEVRASVG